MPPWTQTMPVKRAPEHIRATGSPHCRGQTFRAVPLSWCMPHTHTHPPTCLEYGWLTNKDDSPDHITFVQMSVHRYRWLLYHWTLKSIFVMRAYALQPYYNISMLLSTDWLTQPDNILHWHSQSLKDELLFCFSLHSTLMHKHDSHHISVSTKISDPIYWCVSHRSQRRCRL